MGIQYFLNSLRIRPERAYGFLGALDALGFPMENVHIVWGKHWRDFEDQNALCDAAIADGFPQMELVRNIRRPGYIAAMWSFFRTFRAIQSHNIQRTMVFEDDCTFKIPYERVKRRLDDLPKNTKIGITGYHTHRENLRDLKPCTRHWGLGVRNYNSSHNAANFYTPEGIQMIFNLSMKKEFKTIENIIGELHMKEGVYSLLKSIVKIHALQGRSDAMPGEDVEDQRRITNSDRWKQGYNVG